VFGRDIEFLFSEFVEETIAWGPLQGRRISARDLGRPLPMIVLVLFTVALLNRHAV